MAKAPVQSVVIKRPVAPRPVVRDSLTGLPVNQARPQPRPAGYPGGGDFSATLGGLPLRGTVPPVKTGAHGLVTSPVPALQPPAKAAPKVKPQAPKVRVIVHPSGKIEVHQAAPAAPAAPAPNSPSAITTKIVGGRSGKYQTDSQGRTDTTLNRRPGVAPAGRGPATAAAPTTAPLTVEQQAQNLLDPVKQSILDAINGRVAAQQAAITNYAKDLASMMGQYSPDAKADFGNAETGQAAIDAALAQTLSGAGTSGQADLAGKLAQIDADPGTVARITGQAGQNTQGAVGAAAARGASALSQLVGEGANAQDYGDKLPGLAGLYGLQATKSAQSQGTTDAANAVAQIEQQLPSVVQTLKTDTNQNKQLRFEHGVALLQANGGVVTPTIKALLGGALPVGATRPAAAPKADSTLSKAFGFLVDAGGNPILRGGKEVTLPKSSTTTAKKANAALSKSLGYVVDSSGEPILQGGKKVMLPAQPPKVSATATRDKAKALGLARIGHTSTTDGKGVTHPAVSWQQYLSTGLSQGIPASVLIAEGKKVYSQREIKLGLIPGVNK